MAHKITFEVEHDDEMSESELALVKKTMSDLHILVENLSAYGFEIEMVRESLHPPAMGHVRLVARVWRKK